ncbi:MAG TPA: hypothetical protein VGR70_04205 [Stellaceae bacterium]|nr:hypothetical protein [Stellaceae bacterium]
MADMGIGEMLALGSVAAGTAFSAFSSVNAGNQQASAYQFNQQVQQENASIVRQEAASQAAIDRQQTERTLGNVKAAYGAGGVDPNRGTPLDVMADQAMTGELTRQLDLYRGEVAATGDINQANLLGYEAQQARSAGENRAVATIFSGLGQAALTTRLPWSSPTPSTSF